MPAGRPLIRIEAIGDRTGRTQQRAEGELPHLMVRGNANKGQTGSGIFRCEGPQKSRARPVTRGLGT